MSSVESRLVLHTVLYSFTVPETKLHLCICRFNSAKKDNDFIYHDSVPSLETLASVKGNNRKEFHHVYTAKVYFIETKRVTFQSI